MKKFLSLLLVCSIISSCQFNNKLNEYNKNEIIRDATTMVETLIELTLQKELDKLMTLYLDTNDFRFIDNEGKTKHLQELRELYEYLFTNLHHIKIIENKIEIVPTSKETAICTWQGKEEIKMKEGEIKQSSWTATIILLKIENNWKIGHLHITHF